MKFSASRSKIERADKHIFDLNKAFETFSKSDFYSISVKNNGGNNDLFIDIDKSSFSEIDAALIIGDALHNLRSAVDIAYYRAFRETTGIVDHRTQFPIRNERQELISAIDGGLKKKGLFDYPSAVKIRNLIVDVIKPYQAGNPDLWALHDMSITDKHQLLIPTFKVMRFMDIRLQDERKDIFLADNQPYYTEESYRFKIKRTGRLTVYDKGNAATAIVFNVGIALQNEPVIPALKRIAVTVTRAIDAFEDLQLRGFFY